MSDEKKPTNWTLIEPVTELMRRLELHLESLGVHDNQRCAGLWLHLFPDGSGYLMQNYVNATEDESKEMRLLHLLFSEKCERLAGFDSLEELHGELVALTMKVPRGSDE